MRRESPPRSFPFQAGKAMADPFRRNRRPRLFRKRLLTVAFLVAAATAEAGELHPGSSDLESGRALFREENYPEALTAYRRALSLNSMDSGLRMEVAAAHVAYAEYLKRKKRFREAAAEFTESLELN